MLGLKSNCVSKRGPWSLYSLHCLLKTGLLLFVMSRSRIINTQEAKDHSGLARPTFCNTHRLVFMFNIGQNTLFYSPPSMQPPCNTSVAFTRATFPFLTLWSAVRFGEILDLFNYFGWHHWVMNDDTKSLITTRTVGTIVSADGLASFGVRTSEDTVMRECRWM